jgi:ubiquitin-activating enzyme E1
MDKIDSDRYSRQLYSIGQDVMCKISKATILVIGYSTHSLEIIKNLVLLGIGNIDISNKQTLERWKQTGMYYKYDDDIPLEQFKKLNPTINISKVNIYKENNEIDMSLMSRYNLIIATNVLFDEAKQINSITRSLNIPFIMSGVCGLMGYVFNDWKDFTVLDVDGETYENLLIEMIDGKMIKFKEQHNLSDGDILMASIIQEDGSILKQEIQVKETKTPLLIEMKEIPIQDIKLYKHLIKHKISQTFMFKSLEEDTPISAIMADFSVSPERTYDLHMLYMAYSEYVKTNKRIPKSWDIADYECFIRFIPDFSSKTDEFKLLSKKFCFTLKTDILPFVSIISAVASHEVLKALGHKYIPIQQWYFTDYYDLIDDKEIQEFNTKTVKRYRSETKYEGLINALGIELVEKIQNTKPFIIGSGAIGCELIKNLGMLGVKEMIITDMDYIEKSNLSRQFLFNDEDIRQSKAQTASKKIKLMNPDVNVSVYEYKVCKETEDIFNKDFHNTVDIYLNALDNVDARLYVDKMAIQYEKPLIDSGTLGSKANTQVIIPHLTDSYGSTKDPEEKIGIPICTIKSFPFKQAHTIQWARELFETEFNEIPNQIRKYETENLTTATPTEIMNMIKYLYKYRNFSISKEGFHSVLSHIFLENFDYGIKQLLLKYQNPENKLEIEGKVMPTILDIFDEKDRIYNFMKYGFNILSQMFNTLIEYNIEEHNILADEAFNIDYDKIVKMYEADFALGIIHKISTHIKSIDFEKDDDSLGHVDWLLTTSNIRNFQYKIEESDLHNTRKIAGNIIPAMITTTSLISGFQIMEFIKIVKYYNKGIKPNKTDIDRYKNHFVNLSINYIDGSNPNKAIVNNIGKKELTFWDKLFVETNNIEKIMKDVYDMTGKNIEFIMFGNEVIYDGETIMKNVVDMKDNFILTLIEDIPTEIPIYLKT